MNQSSGRILPENPADTSEPPVYCCDALRVVGRWYSTARWKAVYYDVRCGVAFFFFCHVGRGLLEKKVRTFNMLDKSSRSSISTYSCCFVSLVLGSVGTRCAALAVAIAVAVVPLVPTVEDQTQRHP